MQYTGTGTPSTHGTQHLFETQCLLALWLNLCLMSKQLREDQRIYPRKYSEFCFDFSSPAEPWDGQPSVVRG